MRKHAKRHAQPAVYQPSDFVSVVAIGITALILVLSLFAMERFAGVPVSVRGEPIYTEPVSRKPKITKSSQTAKRAASRKSHASQPAASGSTSSASSSICENAACSNLLSALLNGDPACMKQQVCVDSLYRTISQDSCANYKPCAQLAAVYGFFYANQSCVSNFTSACKTGVDAVIVQYR